MVRVQIPVVRYRIPRYVYKRVLVEVEQKLPQPVKTGLAARFASTCNWLLTPIHVVENYFLFVIKPYQKLFLWSCLYVCLFLILTKIILYAILTVSVC